MLTAKALILASLVLSAETGPPAEAKPINSYPINAERQQI